MEEPTKRSMYHDFLFPFLSRLSNSIQATAFLGLSAYTGVTDVIYPYPPPKLGQNAFAVIRVYCSSISMQGLVSPSLTTAVDLKAVNICLVALYIVIRCLKTLIFGDLSRTEIRNIREKVSYTVWEYFLGFLIFYFKSASTLKFNALRFELVKFAGLFLCVSLLKSFHYLSTERVKTFALHSSDAGSRDKYRLCLGLFLLILIDIILAHFFFVEVFRPSQFSDSQATLHNNILISIFGFEILLILPLILLTMLLLGVALFEQVQKKRYGGSGADAPQSSQNSLARWFELKYKIFYWSEFAANFLRFSMICAFSVVFLYIYTFPFHILPTSYTSLRASVHKARQLVNFQKKRILFNKLVIVPVTECKDLDETCVVCFDDFEASEDTRRLVHCHHVFHGQCLQHWIDYSRACPICREPI